MYVCEYIYIYTYTHIYIYVYAYVVDFFPKPRAMAGPFGKKPHGCGRMAKQRVLRSQRAKWLTFALFRRLDVDAVERSMVLIPAAVNLKKRRWRRTFAILTCLEGRVYTTRMCQSVIRRLLRMLPFTISIPPNSTSSEFVTAQAERLQKVAKAAKRMMSLKQYAREAWLGVGNLRITSEFG